MDKSIVNCPQCNAPFHAVGGAPVHEHAKVGTHGYTGGCEYEKVRVLFTDFPLRLPAQTYIAKEHERQMVPA